MVVDMKQTFVTDNYQDEGHGHEILLVHLIVNFLNTMKCLFYKGFGMQIATIIKNRSFIG